MFVTVKTFLTSPIDNESRTGKHPYREASSSAAKHCSLQWFRLRAFMAYLLSFKWK